MRTGAFCSSDQMEDVTSALWLGADKKGCYTMLSATESPACELEDEGDAAPPLTGPERPLAFDFDAVCLFSGTSEIVACCLSLGLRPSPAIDLRFSVEYDVRIALRCRIGLPTCFDRDVPAVS